MGNERINKEQEGCIDNAGCTGDTKEMYLNIDVELKPH